MLPDSQNPWANQRCALLKTNMPSHKHASSRFFEAKLLIYEEPCGCLMILRLCRLQKTHAGGDLDAR